MIVVRLVGGLGNQMFQYAVGRRLSLDLEAEMKLDVSWYINNARRSYDLNRFAINESFATPDLISRLKYRRRSLLDFIFRRPKPFSAHYVKEKEHFVFDRDLLSMSGDIYLDGFWQSESYFLDIKQQIIDDFTLRNEPSSMSLYYKNLIEDTNSISVHFRRGDYVTNPAAANHHGLCSAEYYQASIDTIASEVSDPVFFLFSDDYDWVKNNISIPFSYHIIDSRRGDHCSEDIYLMSSCKHNVIANSSFSWWGAWMNKNKNKIVIAPKVWLKKEPNLRTTDLLPPKWVRM